MEFRIAGKYRVGRKIGSGSFGEIYIATNIQNNEQVAVKMEKVSTNHPQLLYEARLYRVFLGDPGIPQIFWFGVEGTHNVMVMELLGQSLEELLQSNKGRLSLKTVLLLADQMIKRIEYVHHRSYLHRDIKPDNFLLGLGSKANTVFVIDFGLSKRYKDSRSNAHIPYRDGKSLTGTARYASLNTSLGVEQSRRDDMECLLNVFVYLLKGSLPWQGLPGNTKNEKYRNIMEKKMTTNPEILCSGLPSEFVTFLNYTRALRFEDRPDYNYLRRILNEVYIRSGFEANLEIQASLRPQRLKTENDEEQKKRES
jgi:casein kinase 1